MKINHNIFLTLSFLITPALFSMQTNNLVDALAEQGHPDEMLIVAYKELEKQNPAKAWQWMSRFKIRARQDAACSNDPSAIAAINATIMLEMDPQGEQLTTLKQNDLEEIFIKQLDWAQKKTDANKLPGPEWIAKYGMNQFTGQPKELFVSHSECQKRRKAMLAEYKTRFNHLQKTTHQKQNQYQSPFE